MSLSPSAPLSQSSPRTSPSLTFQGILALAAVVASANSAAGFALSSPFGPGPADLINLPDNFYSFDESLITWRMSDSFLAAFPDPILQNQVRLAMGEWQTAASSAERRSSTRWNWTRNNGYQPVIDLRTAVIHEVGHALGFQHADASYFNETGPGDTAWNRNYRLDGAGDPFVAPPAGGEVMNEGNAVGFLPSQKPPSGIPPGAYWRTVSRDEVAALDYAYGRPLAFQEVGPGVTPMILVDTFVGGGGLAVGVGGPDVSLFRDPSNHAAGSRILLSSIAISDNPGTPIGLLTRASAWSYTNNTGESLSALTLRSEGTSNGEPLGVTSSGTHRFTDYEQANTTALHQFENRGHRFLEPLGGSIPTGSTVDFGLTLDAWDWSVERATAITTDGDAIGLPLISLTGWVQGGYGSPGSGSSGGAPTDALGLSEMLGQFVPTAQGFRVVASDQRVSLSEVAFASVAGLGLGLDDLNPATLAELDTEGRLVRLPFQTVEIAPGEDLVLVLDGLVDDLPEELQQSGAFQLLNDARWTEAMARGEILVYSRVSGAAGLVDAFSLINSAPIVGRAVPEPTSLLLLSIVAIRYVVTPRRVIA